MQHALLTIESVEKRFGSFTAVNSADVVLGAAERLGIIGPNGSGKTTLINCITGLLTPERGTIRFNGVDITGVPAYRRARLGIARTFQIPRPFIGMSVFENVLVPFDFLGHAQLAAHDVTERIEQILTSVGLAERMNHPSESLSQLELRKLELARALVGEPRMLISDEAMAGLSEAEIDDVLAILHALNAKGVAIIMIEHIMHAVMRFCERIICLESGVVVASGSPQEITDNATVQRVYFGEQARH